MWRYVTGAKPPAKKPKTGEEKKDAQKKYETNFKRQFQMKWLGAKGGSVPEEISAALKRIQALAIKHNLPFSQLCEYIIANMNN